MSKTPRPARSCGPSSRSQATALTLTASDSSAPAPQTTLPLGRPRELCESRPDAKTPTAGTIPPLSATGCRATQLDSVREPCLRRLASVERLDSGPPTPMLICLLRFFCRPFQEAGEEGLPARADHHRGGTEPESGHRPNDSLFQGARDRRNARAGAQAGLFLPTGVSLLAGFGHPYRDAPQEPVGHNGLPDGGLLDGELPARAGIPQTFAMASMQSSTSQGTTTWRIETMDQTNLVFGSIFEEFHEKCVGASKPLQSPSEPVVRVLWRRSFRARRSRM